MTDSNERSNELSIEDFEIRTLHSSEEYVGRYEFFDASEESSSNKLRTPMDLEESEDEDEHEQKKDPSVNGLLSLKTLTQTNELSCGAVHKIWSTINLETANFPYQNNFVDLVFCIDISASMKTKQKFNYVQKVMRKILERLHSQHRVSLVIFNHVATILSPLLEMTPGNKRYMMEEIQHLEPNGSTNISDALFTALDVIKARRESFRLASILFLTDGLANRGLSSKVTLKILSEKGLPAGCSINTFGYGNEHNSGFLLGVALKTGGTYYYIEKSSSLSYYFQRCLTDIFNTIVHSVQVHLKGLDGCRIVMIATPNHVEELRPAKEYRIDIGSIPKNRAKTVLLKLSLRKMASTMVDHSLVQVIVRYHTWDNLSRELSEVTSIMRPYQGEKLTLASIPQRLDRHINRYAVASVINECIDLCKFGNHAEAKRRLRELEGKVVASSSRDLAYVKDLVRILDECCKAMATSEAFRTGIHLCNFYAGLCYTEQPINLAFSNVRNEDSSRVSQTTCNSQVRARESKRHINLREPLSLSSS